MFVAGAAFGGSLVAIGVYMGLAALLFIVACIGSYTLGVSLAWWKVNQEDV